MAPSKKISIAVMSLLSIIALAGCSDEIGDRYVGFAKCITEKGAKMYGAYWCPHCANQKKRFGQKGFQHVQYIECDPNGENANPKLCEEKNIQGYPTWEFSDGTFQGGDLELSQLSQKSGCPLSPTP